MITFYESLKFWKQIAQEPSVFSIIWAVASTEPGALTSPTYLAQQQQNTHNIHIRMGERANKMISNKTIQMFNAYRTK